MQGDDLPYPLNGTGMHGTSTRMGFASEKRATLRALLGAALAHVSLACLLIAHRAPSPPRLESPPSPAERAETDVDLVVGEARVDERAQLPSSAPAAASANTVAPLRAGHLAERAHEAPAPVATATGEQPPGPLTLLREAVPAPIGLALQGPNPFQAVGALPDLPGGALEGPGEPLRAVPRAPTRAEAKHNAENALRTPARDRERELGLGPDGPVLAALGEAASLGTTDVKGRAVFVAIADAGGVVVGIDVLECDGGRAGWTNAANAARAALKGKTLRLPSTAKGARMRIEVVSEWKMPSGHDPGTDVSVLGIPVAKGEGKKSTSVELLNLRPKLASVELGPGVKVTVPTVGMTIIGVNGDPANIGAKPRRVVHARLLGSQVF